MSIVVDSRILLQVVTRSKADGFQWPEGSSPECDRASAEDTTGV
jgi:hypothetical protein